MKSEATAAAEHKGKVIMHDPFAMRPFFGYNFGQYLQHWLSMETAIKNPGRVNKLPKIYHVNWFRKDDQVMVIFRVNNNNILFSVDEYDDTYLKYECHLLHVFKFLL